MGEVSTIGLDLAKAVFQAHGADASGGVIFRKKLRRDQLLAFFASQPLHRPTEIATPGRLNSPPLADRNRHLRPIEFATLGRRKSPPPIRL